MPRDHIDHFLKLARRKSPLVPYAARSGKAYYVNAPSVIGMVLRDSVTFRPTMHPFRDAKAHVAPSGNILLGFDRAPGSFANALIRTRERTQRFCLERMDPRRIDGRSFYLCMKELSFLIAADVLFDFDAALVSGDVGDASDVVEEMRARFGLAEVSNLSSRYVGKYAESLSVLSNAAVLIQRAQGHPPEGKVTHAIVETMLNAFVPISYALIWSILLLGGDTKTQDAVHAQAHVRPSSPSNLTASKERLVDRVVRESLRLFPPAWLLGRVCTAAASVDGTSVLPGQFLTICPYAVQRSPMLWNHPDLFDPDRFVVRKAYSYFPFGGGGRICPAARFVPHMLSVMIEGFIELFSIRTRTFPKPLGLIGLRPGPELDIRIRRRAIRKLRSERRSRG